MTKKKNTKSFKFIIFLVFLLLITVLIYVVKTSKNISKGWRLTIYENSNGLDSYQVQEIEGFSSSLKCQEKGASLINKNQKYSCGLDCDKNGTICKKICGMNGCN